MKKIDKKKKEQLRRVLKESFGKVLKEAKVDTRFINKEQLPQMLQKSKQKVAELSARLRDETETLRELEALAKSSAVGVNARALAKDQGLGENLGPDGIP